MDSFAVGLGQPEICKDLEVKARFMAMFSQRRTVPALFKDDFQSFPSSLPLSSNLRTETTN